jgi:Holliday junction resolvase RusA-like endonuclease
MSSYGFSVPLIPTKRRVRFVRSTGRTYTDARTQAEMEAVRAAYRGPRFAGAVMVTVTALGCLPKSAPKRLRKRDAVHKPDADNIAKAVLDALNGVAWDDDAQVTTLLVRKSPDRRRANPRTFVTIEGEVIE